jgi:hypothetical protein
MSNTQTVASGKRHTLQDSGVKLYILNDLSEDLIVIKTDDDAFLTQNERHNHQISDFYLHGTQHAWLAELKDNENDFGKACDQISSALDVIASSRHQSLLCNKLIRAFIVSSRSRVPAIADYHVKNVCKKLKARSSGRNKPENILDYLKSVRCVRKVNGTPSQDGSTVDNAPDYPLHIKA